MEVYISYYLHGINYWCADCVNDGEILMKQTAYLFEWDGNKSVSLGLGHIMGEGVKVTKLYAIPAGYKLVSLEPTEEIIICGCKEIGDVEQFDSIDSRSAYKAMIEASPNIEDI